MPLNQIADRKPYDTREMGNWMKNKKDSKQDIWRRYLPMSPENNNALEIGVEVDISNVNICSPLLLNLENSIAPFIKAYFKD